MKNVINMLDKGIQKIVFGLVILFGLKVAVKEFGVKLGWDYWFMNLRCMVNKDYAAEISRKIKSTIAVMPDSIDNPEKLYAYCDVLDRKPVVEQ